MERNSRRAVIICSILIVIALVGFGYLMYYSYITSKNTTQQFVENRRNLAKKTYKRILDHSPDVTYPETPEELMQLQADIILMLYGKMILDDNIFVELIEMQRELWSEDITSKITVDEQLNNLKEELALYEEHDVYARTVSIERPFFGSDETSCVIVLVREDFMVGTVEFNYYLELSEEGKWTIMYWEKRDKSEE